MACVPRRRSGCQESMAMRGRFFGDNYGTWRHVERFRVTGFLGFGHRRSWSTSVVLFSSGEAWICTNLSTLESSLHARDVFLMPRIKFGSDTILNVLLAMRCVIPCCIC